MYLKMLFTILTLKGQRSFRGLGTFMTQVYIDGWTLIIILAVVLDVQMH